MARRKQRGQQLGLGLASGPEDFGQWFTSQDFPAFGARAERWSKRTGEGIVWVTIEPEPGNPYCRLQSGGPGRRTEVPWSELRSKVEARRADLWRSGYVPSLFDAPGEARLSEPPAQRSMFGSHETIDWAAMEAEAKRRFGPRARVGYAHTRPDLDNWRPVGYVAGTYPILLPRE